MKFDEAGLSEVLREIERKIDAADRHFRSTHAGLPVEVVRADARDALPDGITLGDDDLDAYAQAVADDEPFEFRLVG